MLKTYLKTGVLPYFTVQITNENEGGTVGKQTVVLYNVKLQKLPIAILDADAEHLTMDVSFSYTNIEVLNAFNAPAQLGE